MRTAFEYEGEIRGVDLLACLVTLWRESASGSLQFSRSGASAGFEIVAGEIAATSTSDPRFETAAILVRAGKLDTRTLERLAAPEGADRALLALQAGVLTRREYRWGEKIRAVEILSDLSTWLDGEYFFFRASEAAKESTEPRLPIPRLILELFLRSRDRSLVLKYLGGADVPLARAPNFDAEFATFGLTADAESVVRLIDGTSSAEEIASEAPAEAFAIEKLLAALVTLGLVHPAFAAAAPASERSSAVPVEEAAGEPEPVPVESAESPEDETPEEEVSEEEAEEEIAAELPAGATSEEEGAALDSWDAGAPTPAPEPEEERREGPSELGESIEDEAITEEEPVDAPLAGRSVAPDLEFAPLGDEPARGEERLAADVEGGPPLDHHADTAELGPADRPPSRSGSPFLWVLVLLALVVGAIVWLRGRGTSPAPTGVAALAPTKTEIPAAAGPASSAPTPEAAAVVPPPTAPPAPTSAPPTAAPAAKARPTPRPTLARGRPAVAAPPAAASTAADTKDASRQHWIDRASRDQQRLASDRKTRYAIQLELACETSSLVDAFQHDRGGTMWVLATTYQDKTCFRVLWGRYPSAEAAHRALSSAPKFFSTAKNHPAVTGVR